MFARRAKSAGPWESMQYHDSLVGMPDRTSILDLLRASSLLLRSALLLGLFIPLLVGAGFAWHEYQQSLDEASDNGSRSAVALEEHATNVLDTHWLILRQLESQTRDRTWEQIGGDAHLKKSLGDLARDFGQVGLIGLADADGRLWLSSSDGPTPTMSVADRDYFQAHKNGTVSGLFVGEPFNNKRTGARQFGISVARKTATGAFDGVFFTAVPLDYFVSFWRQFAPSAGHVIPLVRSDGAVLVRYPSLMALRPMKPDGPFMTNVRKSHQGIYTAVSETDGVERINAYSQVKDYPLYVSYSVDKEVALRGWRERAIPAAALSVLISATLVALGLLVMRQSQQERRAAGRWREVARHLEHEVARREEAEEAMRQGRKLEAIGQLAGGIAHDFNNLLAGISGNLHLMRYRLEQGRTEELPRYIATAESVIDKASSMTQRLLAFSRRQTLDPRATDANERILSMQELIERSVGPAIRVQTSLAEGPCVILCDANQLDSALLNLAINARDAMPEGGEITIGSARKRVEVQESASVGLPPGEHVAISVKDTGTGMTPEVVQRAFDPFFTTKPIGQGTGLGLSMVYGFVTQSGGQVTIDSAPGAGTTVTIFMPVYDGQAVAPEPPHRTTEALRPDVTRHVLLVDDEETLRVVLSELLGELGYEVAQAADAAGALKVLQSARTLDLMVTDVGLEGNINGRQLADAAREMRPDLKVLFITGYADKGSTGGSLFGSGMEVMIKPFSLDDFAHRVAKMTAAENASDPVPHEA